MEKYLVIFLTSTMLLVQYCQQNKSNQLKAEVVNSEINADSYKNRLILDNLDAILSPFEDMTEYALNKNGNGINKAINRILKVEEKSIFKMNLSTESMLKLKLMITDLQKLVITKSYKNIAILSTEIFDFNTTNFIDANKVKNQIKIEHLDYLGFKTLALLNQDKIDWEKFETTISNVQQVWVTFRKNINDNNLKNSFNYLFEALHLSAKNKDAKMAKILSSMDLNLVDVLENSF